MPSLAINAPLARLAEILHAAMALGPDAWGKKQPRDDAPAQSGSDLSRDLLDLFTLLRDRQVPYLLVGGVALLKYIDGRNTEDIDLLLSAASLADLPELHVTSQTHDFARAQFRGLRVDLLLTANPVFKLAAERHATSHTFGEITVPCATPEGLLLLKLYALPSLYRQGNTQRAALYEADITMLIDRCRPEWAPILASLAPFLDAGAMKELRGIVEECETRIARMGRREPTHGAPPIHPC